MLLLACQAEARGRKPAFAYGFGVAAFSRFASEGWRPGLDLNQDKERCTALASTRFRHRAAAIIARRARRGHPKVGLTLTARRAED
jgi:ribulose 1,5-bisphosphate carboxylase large subunit-like protein